MKMFFIIFLVYASFLEGVSASTLKQGVSKMLKIKSIDSSQGLAKIIGHKNKIDDKIIINYNSIDCNWFHSKAFYTIEGGNLFLGVINFYDNTVDCINPDDIPTKEISIEIPKKLYSKVFYLGS